MTCEVGGRPSILSPPLRLPSRSEREREFDDIYLSEYLCGRSVACSNSHVRKISATSSGLFVWTNLGDVLKQSSGKLERKFGDIAIKFTGLLNGGGCLKKPVKG